MSNLTVSASGITEGITDEYINGIIRKVAAVHNMEKWKYTLEKFENIAQNYFGVLIPVVLCGSIDGLIHMFPLVLKMAPTDDRYRVSGAITVMFIREIFVYTTILKKYETYQEKFPDNLKYIIPRCHYTQKKFCKEVIVLEDMRLKGYEPYTKDMFLNLDHLLISLKALAKLHALSFILKNKDKNLYEEISSTCVPLTDRNNKRYMDILRNRLDKAMTVFDYTEYSPFLTDLRQNIGNVFEKAVEYASLTCICHGDIWKENILYKYKDNKPVSVCLIDYQTTRISSPAFDILYLILSSTNTKVRQKYYIEILDIYYGVFEKVVTEAGLSPNQVYSYKMLRSDLAIVAPACFATANCAMWLSCGLQQEGHVRSKQVLNTQEEKDLAMHNYAQIIKDMIDDLVSYGYIKLEVA